MKDVDDDEVPNNRHVCAGCGQLSPPTTTNFTLISARHGWRLTLTKDEQGRQQPEWRCPTCWQKYRAMS
jgi:hypothetical protein